MKKPTEDEFDIVDGLKAIHRPTGWEGSTYRYDDPADIEIKFERKTHTGKYEHHEIVAMATALLRRAAK